MGIIILRLVYTIHDVLRTRSLDLNVGRGRSPRPREAEHRMKAKATRDFSIDVKALFSRFNTGFGGQDNPVSFIYLFSVTRRFTWCYFPKSLKPDGVEICTWWPIHAAVPGSLEVVLWRKIRLRIICINTHNGGTRSSTPHTTHPQACIF